MSELSDFVDHLPEARKALILAPHPDDETLGCGGTIALYADRIHFTVAALSNGEGVNIPEKDKAGIRRSELEEAGKILGVREIRYCDIPDGLFREHREELRERISEFLNERPDIVFSPSPADMHPDHIETALACIDLLREHPLVKVAFYEVYSPIRFNTLIDIGGKVDVKRAALSSYHYSMLKQKDVFTEANLALNRSRSLFTLRDSFYEAFWIPGSSAEASSVREQAELSPSPEVRLLNSLKVADSLIHQFRSAEKDLAEKENMIRDLTSLLEEKDETIGSFRKRALLVESSLFWKFARKFYQVRDRLMPAGTRRKMLYQKFVHRLKGIPAPGGQKKTNG